MLLFLYVTEEAGRKCVRDMPWPPAAECNMITNKQTIVPDDEGVYPWLGGVDLEEFDRDFVKAAKSIGAVVLSPVHGVPSSSSVNTPGYKPFVTKELVKRAHREGLKVIPWTVSSPVREGGEEGRTLTEGVAG